MKENIKKQYKSPKSRVIVLEPDEILGEGINQSFDKTIVTENPWDDDEAKGSTWEDAMW